LKIEQRKIKKIADYLNSPKKRMLNLGLMAFFVSSWRQYAKGWL
jgi:hypothetical protein